MSKTDALIAETISKAKPGRGGWLRTNCPFCALEYKEDKRWSWGFNPESGYWHCFRCETEGFFGTGEIVFSAKPVTREPVDEMPLPDEFISLDQPAPRVSDDPLDALFGGGDPTEGARACLKRRGVSIELAKRLEFGVCLQGRYRNRLIMPVRVRGVRVGYVARALAKSKIPYLYPEGMPRGEVMINQDVLARETDEPVLVMEGWMDMLPYFNDADVAGCLGKPGDAHIELLVKAKRPIVMVLDGDAWRLGRAVAETLAFRGQRAGFLKLPPKVDPNDAAVRDNKKSWLLRRAWSAVGMQYCLTTASRDARINDHHADHRVQ